MQGGGAEWAISDPNSAALLEWSSVAEKANEVCDTDQNLRELAYDQSGSQFETAEDQAGNDGNCGLPGRCGFSVRT